MHRPGSLASFLATVKFAAAVGAASVRSRTTARIAIGPAVGVFLSRISGPLSTTRMDLPRPASWAIVNEPETEDQTRSAPGPRIGSGKGGLGVLPVWAAT